MSQPRPNRRSHASWSRSGLVWALVLSACGPAVPGGPAGSVPAPTAHRADLPEGRIDAEALVRLALVEERRVQSGDSSFSEIGAVQVGPDGRMYVLESRSRQISLFAPDGSFVRRFGGTGWSPGQFVSSDVTLGMSGDTLWAIDVEPNNRHATFFDPDGRVLSVTSFWEMPIEMHSPDEMSFLVPQMRDAEGFFIGDVGGGSAIRIRMNGTREPPRDSILIPRIRFDLAGRVVDTVGYYPSRFRSSATGVLSVGSSTYAVPAPLRDDPLEVRESGGLTTVTRPNATSETAATFRVTRTDFQGDTLAEVTFAYAPERYKPNVLDSVAFRAARSPGGSFGMMTDTGHVSIRRFPQDSAAARPLIRAALRFPDFQPPVQSAFRANDGGLWLQREDTPAETVEWLVLDTELRPVGNLTLPRSAKVLWSKGDQVWVAIPDAAGSSTLVRYRIQKPPMS